MTEMFKPAADALSNGVSTVMASLEKTKADVTINMQKSMKTAEELVAFGQGNFAAFTSSGQILAAGAQELSKTMVAQAQAQVEETVAAMKSFAGVTSVQGVIELQTAFARKALARAAAETTRLSEASRKLAAEALSPIEARVALAAETFSRAA
jgi:phasin family protein